jgi:hypothetical protein
MKALKFLILVVFSLSGPTVTLAKGSHADKGQDEVGDVGELKVNTKKLARNTKHQNKKVKASNENTNDKQPKSN